MESPATWPTTSDRRRPAPTAGPISPSTRIDRADHRRQPHRRGWRQRLEHQRPVSVRRSRSRIWHRAGRVPRAALDGGNAADPRHRPRSGTGSDFGQRVRAPRRSTASVADNAGNDNATATTVKIDTIDPTTSSPNAAPTPTNHGPTITASVSDVGSGGNDITHAEFFIDVVGVDGAGTAMGASDASFNSPTEGVTGDDERGAVQLRSARASHTVYVHGRDAAGNWGTTASTSVREGHGRARPAVAAGP